MTTQDRDLTVLTAIAESLLPEGAPARAVALGMADVLSRLPDPAQRAEMASLLEIFESRFANLLLAGKPRPFTRLSHEERERYLLGWADSRILARRRGFRAVALLALNLYYTMAEEGGGACAAAAALGYPGPPLATGLPPASIVPTTVSADTTLDCDAVVIGSGAGGGVVAERLAASGRSVIVLERGGCYEGAELGRRERLGTDRLFWRQARGASRDLGIGILAGGCVGGGTVVNYTTSFELPAKIREQWTREHGLPHLAGGELDASYAAVSKRIGVNRDHSRPGRRDEVLKAGLDALGWHADTIPRNVRGCETEECGFCTYGCPRGHKRSTLVTYLRDAAEKGARIIAGCHVERVRIERGRASGVEATIARADGLPPIKLTVRARAVIVAAGSIESPALLMRSGVALPALGRHLALHPVSAVVGVMGSRIEPWTGAPQAVFSRQFADLDRGHGFIFETGPIHPGGAALFLPWRSARQHRSLMEKLPSIVLLAALVRDRDGGRVTLDAEGGPVVDYRLSDYDRAHMRRGLLEGARVLEAAGAREIATMQSRWISYEPAPGAHARWTAEVDAHGFAPGRIGMFSFHQMASCRMGGDRWTSVVNAGHQVWGVRGLHVADGSCFPSASGVNPMLTIMAMAHRAGEVIAAGK